MSVMPGTSTNRAVRSRGFTLIELLAVMLILAILMTLIIGVSKLIFTHVYTNETKNNMKIIMAAITEYHKVKTEYPTKNGWVTNLANVAESRALLIKLDENVWNRGSATKFHDSWGNEIEYYPTGGLAGAPGLTSPGPDGDINTEADNVRYNK